MDYNLLSKKTETMVLKGRRRNCEFGFNLAGTHIPITREIKYLGLVIDHRMVFGSYIRHMANIDEWEVRKDKPEVGPWRSRATEGFGTIVA